CVQTTREHRPGRRHGRSVRGHGRPGWRWDDEQGAQRVGDAQMPQHPGQLRNRGPGDLRACYGRQAGAETRPTPALGRRSRRMRRKGGVRPADVEAARVRRTRTRAEGSYAGGITRSLEVPAGAGRATRPEAPHRDRTRHRFTTAVCYSAAARNASGAASPSRPSEAPETKSTTPTTVQRMPITAATHAAVPQAVSTTKPMAALARGPTPPAIKASPYFSSTCMSVSSEKHGENNC